MQAISLWLAAAIVILTGWAIVKKYQVKRDKLSSEECHCHRPFRL